jgi:hypothetical protein
MGLMPAFYTTTVTRRKSKTKVKPKSAHEVWLEKNGLSLHQIAAKKVLDKNWKKAYNESIKVERDGYVSAGLSGDASSCSKRDLMSNLHKETEQVRKEVLLKASRVMPLYNKGGLQYATPATDMTTVGTKSRRG